MVCLGNICINTLHKGDNNNDDDNNNNAHQTLREKKITITPGGN
jgi:hypothetical protein